MSDPQTANIGLYQPLNGSDSGVWDKPENANEGATDSLFCNVAVIPLTAGLPVTLGLPPNSGAAWSGPYQNQSAVLRFTGILPNSVTVTIPRAGFFIVENLCTGAFVVKLASSTPGNKICAPPGEMTHIFCDGTDCKYANLGRIGTYIDVASTTVPAWITNCDVPPYLNCDGTTFNVSTYPALNVFLGGNTLPDSRGRARAALNQGTGRYLVTNGGLDGNTLFAGGATDTNIIVKANIPNYNLNVIEPVDGSGNVGHFHTIGQTTQALGSTGINIATNIQTIGSTKTSFATTGITVNTGGSSSPISVVQPTFISGLTLIRAA